MVEPLAMDAELAAGIDQTVHHQQLQDIRPRNVFPSWRQLLFPELVQLQLPPELAAQPAVAEGPGALEFHLVELYLHAVEGVGGHRTVFGKQAPRGEAVLIFIEHFERFAPRRFLAVVDFAEVENLALRHFAGTQTPAFDHGVVAVFLAVFDPFVAAKEHASEQNARIFGCWIVGRSPLQALGKCFIDSKRLIAMGGLVFAQNEPELRKSGYHAILFGRGTSAAGRMSQPDR